MLQNASLLAIVAVDTEENEPIKDEVWWVRRHFGGPRRASLLLVMLIHAEVEPLLLVRDAASQAGATLVAHLDPRAPEA